MVEFLVFNSIGQLISLPSDEVYRIGDGGPDHAVVLHIMRVTWSEGADLKPAYHGYFAYQVDNTA